MTVMVMCENCDVITPIEFGVFRKAVSSPYAPVQITCGSCKVTCHYPGDLIPPPPPTPVIHYNTNMVALP